VPLKGTFVSFILLTTLTLLEALTSELVIVAFEIDLLSGILADSFLHEIKYIHANKENRTESCFFILFIFL
jgi:hypothetical protein